ncbi:MAG: quinolinate synthase NadA [Deltaproteobacteria bacterium]|nr:quinolinate synthase NadA [Deltaproteobacteria bacterium]
MQHDISQRFTAEETCAPLDRQPEEAVLAELRALVAEVQGRSLFLIHYYQPTWIKRLLREAGAQLVEADSQALARAGRESDRELLVCITVPFMAGSSAILARPEQQVVLADVDAGCSLEASAPEDLVVEMLERTALLAPTVHDARTLQRGQFIPVCYTNVSAQVKAVTGEFGGIICTSSNATNAVRWVLERGGCPVFLPDQHLAANVAAELGLSRLAFWRHTERDGGLTDTELREAELVVWTGECNVHVKTEAEVIEAFVARHPRGHLLLHPEVPHAHVRVALARAGREHVGVGSTRFIHQRLAQLAEAEPGATVGIATETNFVSELQEAYRGKLEVQNLLRNVCACVHMRTRPEALLGALRAITSGALERSRHLVHLSSDVRTLALAALERSLMLKDEPFTLNWTA